MDDFLVTPEVGDLWQDATGDMNLVVVSDNRLKRCTILVLSGKNVGKYYDHEPWSDWNDLRDDGMPFYRVQLA